MNFVAGEGKDHWGEDLSATGLDFQTRNETTSFVESS